MAGLPWIAAMAFFMQALDATILNTALPAIAHSLNRSPLAMQSAIISYTLTVAMLIPVSGWLADRFGTRRIFMIAVTLFTLGSLACALSTSLLELVIFRVIQGIGGAMMMPVARLALLRAYPRSELLPVLNFVTMPGLVGPILGPVLGGVLVTWASWHWIFLINIPIGITGLIYARKYMPNFTTPKRSFDMSGFLLFGPEPGAVLQRDGAVRRTYCGKLDSFRDYWHQYSAVAGVYSPRSPSSDASYLSVPL
jgi:Arabinose efflux permease